ncbi:hypothetical protein BgiMline_023170 [Biomphalaria glabrata]|nr:CAunnamed protein product [Biomphalaria glabrata]
MVSLIILLASVGLVLGHTGQKWHSNRYLDLLYGVTANLTCADEGFSPWEDVEEFRFLWILPNTKVLNDTTVLDNQHYSWMNNGASLLIYNIDRPDFGIYHCLVQTLSNNIHTVVKLGININGPYFGNLWEIYSPNMKIGLISGFVVLVVMSMFCYNYDQFQAKHDLKEKTIERPTVMAPNRNDENTLREMFYKNPVFVDDTEQIKITQDELDHSNNINVSAEIAEVKSSL